MLPSSQATVGPGGFPIPALRTIDPPNSKLRRLSRADLLACRDFAEQLSPEDVHRRFGTNIADTESLARRLILFGRPGSESYAVTNLDGNIVALGNLVPIGAGAAEIALIVRSDWKRRGLGTSVLRRLAARAKETDIHRLVADVLSDNTGMIALARRQGAIFDGFSGLHVELHFDLVSEPLTSKRANPTRAQRRNLQ